jgi:hypothetical protein
MLLEGTCGRSTREVSPCVVRAHRSQPRARAVSTQPQPEQSVSSRATGLAGSRMQARTPHPVYAEGSTEGPRRANAGARLPRCVADRLHFAPVCL